MSRVVLERWGDIGPVRSRADRERLMVRVQEAADGIRGEMLRLARAEPPHLEEQPLCVRAWTPDATGRNRYRVSAVMNTEKGLRLVSP